MQRLPAPQSASTVHLQVQKELATPPSEMVKQVAAPT
jgi:hypothetical protein